MNVTTYILLTKSEELYCGKTTNIEHRFKEHRRGRNGSWFSSKDRQDFIVLYQIDADFEYKIKRFGIRNFIKAIKGVYTPDVEKENKQASAQ
jgi:predicted GIY-YIG superfamily endonuclease